MTKSAPAISLKDVRFAWHKAKPVIDIPSFEVAAGEHVFVDGPSGSGKSTLLSLLTGIAVANSGSVRVLDADFSAMAPGARDIFRAERIGVIFQQFNLLPYLSVIENVLLPCQFSASRSEKTGRTGDARRAAAIELLERLGIARDIRRRKNVTALSVGQQQRVAAARALIGSPDLIIADEPTSSLDAANRDAFLKTLLSAAEQSGATVIFVSHDRGLSERFGRAVRLADINQAAEKAA